MPRKTKGCDLNHLINIPLPTHGDTYTVISHKFVIDYSKTALTNAGFKIVDEIYRCSLDGNIAQGIYRLDYNNDPELSMMFAWTNSYNKQVRFKCGIGTYINQTGNVMVAKDIGLWTRKHTGKADEETKNTIDEQINTAHMYYNQLVSDKDIMKEVNLDVRKMSQLLGVLFAEYEIFSTQQASIVRQEIGKPSYNFEKRWSLWAFYNYATLALQKSHPKTWMEDQRILHYFIDSIVNFTEVKEEVNDDIEDEVSEETFVDPNQVDLEDAIAEIEADVEMQEIKTEEIIEEREEEDNTPMYDEDQIAERIKEDEAAVAEVCGEPKITDAEAIELIALQELIDKEVAKEEEKSEVSTSEADFDLDFTDSSDKDDNIDNVEFNF